MSTTERKARKRAGIPFVKKEKTPTPPEERSYVVMPVYGPHGTRTAGDIKRRSQKKIDAFLDRFSKSE